MLQSDIWPMSRTLGFHPLEEAPCPAAGHGAGHTVGRIQVELLLTTRFYPLRRPFSRARGE